MATYIKKCDFCGVEFQSHNIAQRFCSFEHNRSFHKANIVNKKHQEIVESKIKARKHIPETFEIEYKYKEFFVRDLLSISDSTSLSHLYRSNMKKNLPLKDRTVKRSDGRVRSIPSLYCSTKDMFDLIQEFHSQYRQDIHTSKKRCRNKIVKWLRIAEIM